jgi:hypothetical protein
MFMASRQARQQRSHNDFRRTAMIIAVLIFANMAALLGLGAGAYAQGFPDAIPYAPHSWEKPDWTPSKREVTSEEPGLVGKTRTVTAAATGTTILFPVTRARLAPTPIATNPGLHHFSASTAVNRFSLIALMTAALGLMGGVSIHMFRSLAREVEEAERKRRRF